MILLAWFDYLEESFSYKAAQFKMFCPPVKTSFPLVENATEFPRIHVAFSSTVYNSLQLSIL